MKTTKDISAFDPRNLQPGQRYAFSFAGLCWRECVRVRQTRIAIAGMSVPATEVLHRIAGKPDVMTVNYAHGAKVFVEI